MTVDLIAIAAVAVLALAFRVHYLFRRVVEQQEKLMADFTNLNNSLAELEAKQAAAFTDLKAVIAKGTPENPTIQASIDAATAQIQTLTANAAAADPGPQ
jgi:hypothetical protein